MVIPGVWWRIMVLVGGLWRMLVACWGMLEFVDVWYGTLEFLKVNVSVCWVYSTLWCHPAPYSLILSGCRSWRTGWTYELSMEKCVSVLETHRVVWLTLTLASWEPLAVCVCVGCLASHSTSPCCFLSFFPRSFPPPLLCRAKHSSSHSSSWQLNQCHALSCSR